MEIRSFSKVFIKRAIDYGFEFIELFYFNKKSTKIEIYGGDINNLTICDEIGVCISGRLNGKTSQIYTENLDEDIIDILIERLKSNLGNINVPMSYNAKYYNDVIEINSFRDTDVNKKIELLKQLEKETLILCTSNMNISYCIYAEDLINVHLINSNNMYRIRSCNKFYLYLAIMVKSNKGIKSVSDCIAVNNFEKLQVNELIKKVINDAIILENNEIIKSGYYDVVIRNDVMAKLFSKYVVLFLNCNNINIGKIKSKIGEKMFSELITIIDDPHHKDGINNTYFDDEGNITYKKELVLNGIVKCLLESTTCNNISNFNGNGFRVNYKHSIKISYTNIYIKQSECNKFKIINNMEKGLYITSIKGINCSIDVVSGDFSIPIGGRCIMDGKLCNSFDNVLLSGNFFELLNSVEDVANDLSFYFNGVGAPTIKFKNLFIVS